MIPVNIAQYLKHITGNDSGLTEDDFSKEDLAALRRAVSRKPGKYGEIGYGDYGKNPGEFSSFGDPGQSLFSIINESFNDPNYRLETTLGEASFVRNNDGTITVLDEYNFNATRDQVNKELKKKGVVKTLIKAFETDGYAGVGNALGNIFGKTEDEKGGKVNIKLVEHEGQLFEFDDDVSDDEAMAAMDDWGLQQPKYSSNQVSDMAAGFGQYLRDVFSGKIAKDAFEKHMEVIDRIGTGEGSLEDFMEFVGPGGVGTFVGSKVIPKARQVAFEAAEKSGKNQKDLWSEFGMYRGPEGKLRAELDDSKSDFKFPVKYFADSKTSIKDAFKSKPKNENFIEKGYFYGKLKDGFKHDTLLALYPEIGDVKLRVNIDPKNTGNKELGYFDENTNELVVNSTNSKDARTTMLHEIQHKIQAIENFARGGNPELLKQYQNVYKEAVRNKELELGSQAEEILGETFNEFIYKNINKNWNRDQAFHNYLSQAAKQKEGFSKEVIAFSKLNATKRKLILKFNPENERDSYNFYRDLYGEIEARNVEFRDVLNKEGKEIYHPLTTEHKARTGHKILQGHKK